MDFLKFLKAVALAAAVVLPQSALASSDGPVLPKQDWKFVGIFGQFDQAALKRGARVAVEVCMACHSIKYIKFDALKKLGFTEAEVIALAEAQSRNKKDAMLSPMDATSAKDSFGVIPPDLSLMTKARKGYEDYLYAILNGYASDADRALVQKVMEDGSLSEQELLEVSSALGLNAHNPERVKEVLVRIQANENFNKYFPGNFFAMPQPLSDGSVTYPDGVENSLKQMSHDVTTFLAWAAEPTLMERKALGVKVMLYLMVLTIMFYAVKRRVWAKVHH
jgi:ubiquinol-cytochrome c reductase cytochrome c1 subunit